MSDQLTVREAMAKHSEKIDDFFEQSIKAALEHDSTMTVYFASRAVGQAVFAVAEMIATLVECQAVGKGP